MKKELDDITKMAYWVAGAAVAGESIGHRIARLRVFKARSGYSATYWHDDPRIPRSSQTVAKIYRFAGAMAELACTHKVNPASRGYAFEEVCEQAYYPDKRVPHALRAYEQALEVMAKYSLVVEMVAKKLIGLCQADLSGATVSGDDMRALMGIGPGYGDGLEALLTTALQSLWKHRSNERWAQAWDYLGKTHDIVTLESSPPGLDLPLVLACS
jgi:hypothetical protein